MVFATGYICRQEHELGVGDGAVKSQQRKQIANLLHKLHKQ
jgi:hypothetical protein